MNARRRRDGRARATLALLATTWAAALPGCSRPEPAGQKPSGSGELATVEVTEKPDAHASLAEEPVERRTAAAAVAGVLPDDFPRDVPLPRPSSLVDFGRAAGGGPRVVLEVQSPPEVAQAAYESTLRSAGFEPAGGGLWRRGTRAVVVRVEPWQGVARIALEIPVRGR